ncbi:MAG TPA: lytic transglycosylase domain-containing protein, partial [Burkholderiales bacterium]|nr:lytic transglycosylase domain-containing protein [Burkholderiales bacterium]
DLEQMLDTEPAPPPPLPRSWLDLFISRAHADNPLDHWVPTREELADYGSRVGGVLQKSAADELRRGTLAAPYDRIYRHLVPATALIESCWRQYVVRGGKVTYLRSQSSSVGVMQINQRVWRGFYEIERLRWDTAYNIRAGSQILARYLKDYAIPYAERTGKAGDVARAAYAVYNAGPRAVGRFDKSPPHPREARVDEKLWTLYQGIASGGQVDLATCGVTTRRTSSAARAQ